MRKKKWLMLLLSGAMAGLMIGVGGTVYLSAPDKTVGAVLFAVGLLTVCSYGMKLFTGAVGYLLTERGRPWGVRLGEAGIIWLGNLCGTVCIGALLRLFRPELAEKAAALASAKLGKSMGYLFAMAIFCGIMMYLAVDLYKTRTGPHQLAGIFVAVPVFILAGFEHSVANMFYLALGWTGVTSPAGAFWLLAVVSVGNAAGSVLLPAAKAVFDALND